MQNLLRYIYTLVLYVLCFSLAQAQHPDNIDAIKNRLDAERKLANEMAASSAKAVRLAELGLWQEASTTLSKLPLSASTKLAKAQLSILQNEFSNAEKLVNEVLQEKPSLTEAILLKARLHIQAWELNKAKTLAQQVLSKQPKQEEAAILIGRVLMLQKQYDNALKWAVKVQKWNPENAAAYLLESEVHFWNQKPELAEKPLIKSLNLNPFNADARFSYGYAIWRRVDATQLNNMAAQWELALAINPLHYVTHWHWGNGHTNLTYADYAQPEDEEVRKALQQADELLGENKVKEAIAEADKIQQHFPESVLPAMLRGSAYYMAFDLDRSLRLDSAQAIFNRILNKKKHYGPAHNGIAAVIKQKQLTYLHNYDSLQQVIQTTEIKDPKNFVKVFPDVIYYPGSEVQKMVWSQLYESIVYFPFLSKQGEKFVIPPLHKDLAIAMGSPFFRQATTFDNRQWMDIRGVGSGAAAIEYVVRGSYLERNVVLHEYVHLFHGRVFTDAENRTVRDLYHKAMAEGRTLDYYSANNEHEYLAQTYPAYFEPVKVHPLNHKSINTTADLKAKDPALYAFLDKLVVRQRAYLAGDKQAMASNWAQVYLNLAKKAQAKKEFSKATSLLDTALVWDATYQPALIAYATLKQEQDDFKTAEEWLQKAKDVDVTYAPVYVAEAQFVEAIRRAGKISDQEALKQQEVLFSKALSLEKDLLMQAYTNQQFREMYLDFGRVPEAIKVAEEYVASAPAISTYLRDRRDEALAFANWLKGTSYKSADAAQSLANLVALKPQNYELRKQLAEVYLAQGAYEKAFNTLDEAQRILTAASTPRSDFTVLMAESKLQLGAKDEAAKLSKSLVQNEPKKISNIYRFIGVLARTGNKDLADKLLKQQPEAATVHEKAQQYFASAQLKQAEGKASKAIKLYKKGLELFPYNLLMRDKLMQLLQEKGKHKEAQKLKMLSLQPLS